MTQRAIVTIDVEAPIGDDGVNNLIYGLIGEQEYGIKCIMDILDEYSIKGLFFVDIAEAFEYGEEAISKVITSILDRGHFCGVHLHPDRMNKKKKKFLWEYTYNEQLEMISWCTDFYKRITGRYPVSFRAGRYGANNDTLNILKELGYKVDMSMYFGMKKRCKIAGDYKTINGIKNNNGLLEYPVTVFESFHLFKYIRFDKIDESMPYCEFCTVVKKAIKQNNVDVINFFVHSFSFLFWRKNPDKPLPNKRSIRRFRKMLSFLSNKGCLFLKEPDLVNNSPISSTGILKNSHSISGFFFSVIRFFKIVCEKATRNI